MFYERQPTFLGRGARGEGGMAFVMVRAALGLGYILQNAKAKGRSFAGDLVLVLGPGYGDLWFLLSGFQREKEACR